MADNIIGLKKTSAFTKFFWNACGAEIEVLKNCGSNDRVKYFCLGGIVIATGLMAGLSGGYAFYTIFQPKGYVLSDAISPITAIFSIIFGFLWGVMIYNLDRYIVASSGIGDGTEKITWWEFKTALPRIIMGIIIAITISKPVEIRMFKTEIDNELYKIQLNDKANFTMDANMRSGNRRLKLDEELDIYNKRLDGYAKRIEGKDKDVELERARGGRGVETNRLQAERDAISTEKNEYVANNASRIQYLRSQLEQVNNDVQEEISRGDQVASKLDGLTQRIKLAHKVAGWPTIIFITLLFMVIELTPIIFKLMVKKSNYDIMLDEYKNNILVKSGLVPDNMNLGTAIPNKNILREENIRQLTQKVALQKEIFDTIYDKYRTDLLSKIEADYTQFINMPDIKVDVMPDFENMAKPNIKPNNNGDNKNTDEIIPDNDESKTETKPFADTIEPLEDSFAQTEGNTQFEESKNNKVDEKPNAKDEANKLLDYTGPDFEVKE